MEAWLIWLILAAAMIIIELLTQWVATFCLAIGCIAALVAELCGASLAWQLIWLAIATVVAFICFIPMFRRRLEHKQHSTPATGASNMDAIIGRKARVIVDIPAGGVGRVKIDGDNWQARCDTAINAGAEVIVTGYDSIILNVTPAE